MPRTRSARKHRRPVRSPTISTSPTRTPTKGTVVTTLSKLLSVPTSEIATIGDMPNDVLMFRKSGLSIAMGNASPEVQAQADLVTDSYDDEGFAKAIERFILHARLSLPRAS